MILLLIHLYCWEYHNLLRRHESATLVGWLRRHSQRLFGKSVALNNFWSSCWSGFCWISIHLKCIFHGRCMSWMVFWLGIFSKEFTGATLSFCGLVTDEKHRKMQHTYIHEKVRNIGSVFPIMSLLLGYSFLVLFFIHSWKKHHRIAETPPVRDVLWST